VKPEDCVKIVRTCLLAALLGTACKSSDSSGGGEAQDAATATQPGSGGNGTAAGSGGHPATGSGGHASTGSGGHASMGSGGHASMGSGGTTVEDAGNTPASDSGSHHAADAAVTDSGASLPGWTLTYDEEFDGLAGTGVDTSHWTPQNKGDGFGNNELEFYTPRTDNAQLDGNGSLAIKVIKESYMGRDYTSARLESKDKFEQKYGRFEIRAKLPFGQGIWPAFWLLGNDISDVSWPQCGEIDIMEFVGKTPSRNYGSLHGPGYSGGNPLGGTYDLPDGAQFKDDFHVFAIEWEENVVRWYVDGNLFETRTPADVPQGHEWVYDHPFFMILNVAVGGAFPGSPDDSTMFPQTMLVDYIRVYSR
jgi:beta-glucanase (GH16 family)